MLASPIASIEILQDIAIRSHVDDDYRRTKKCTFDIEGIQKVLDELKKRFIVHHITGGYEQIWYIDKLCLKAHQWPQAADQSLIG